jgi:hypothetical protein
LGLIRRFADVVSRPRATLAELMKAPAWLATWLVILLIWAIVGGSLLSTEVGQQALVDERVRVIETFGGTVSDEEYARLQAALPWWVYLSSGSRTLLTPAATLITAAAIWVAARRDGATASMSQALTIAVHASVVLLIGQLIATPLHYVRESLTSPLNLAALLPFMVDGSPQARFFGTMDLFALWWGGLIAVGLSVLTGRRVGRYLAWVAALFAAFAAVVAVTVAVMGGA